MKLSFYLLIGFLAFIYFEPSLFFPVLGEIRAALLIAVSAFVISFLSGSRPPKAIQNKLFIGLFIIGSLSLVVSPFPFRWVNEYHFSHLYKAIMFYFLVSMVLQDEKLLTKFIYINLILGVTVCLASIIAVKAGIEPLKGGELYRMTNFFGGIGDDPNELGAAFLALLPLPLCMIRVEKTFLRKAANFLFTVILLLGIFRTRSRGAFVGLIIVFFFLLWEYKKDVRIVSLILLLFLGGALHTHSSYWERMQTLKSKNSIEEDFAAYSRVLEYQYALKIISQSPLFGVGLGNFTAAKKEMLGVRNKELANLSTHNAYLALGTDIGLIGMSLFVLAIVFSVYYLRVSVRLFENNKDYNYLGEISKGVNIGLIGLAVSILFLTEPFNLILYQWAGVAAVTRRFELKQDKKNSVNYEK